MVKHHKKICLLICSSIAGLQKDRVDDWLKQMPEINIIAEVEPVFIFGKSSVNITFELWLKLAEVIKNRYDDFSGFVVIHGTDNILYTSSSLSFLIQNLNKPIVFTGSQVVNDSIPANKDLGIRANLINSIQVAISDLNEVALMFGNRLLRANQCNQEINKNLNIFSSPDSAVLGRIDFSIRLYEKKINAAKGKLKIFSQLNSNIEIVNLSPILNLKELTKRIADKDGVIVNLADYYKLPEDLCFLFEKITKDIPVIIWSKNFQAQVIGPKNIMVINNMTWHATLTKLAWALTQVKTPAKILELIKNNIAGEIME